MSRQEIDAYLAGLDEPKRSTLTALRRTIREILPDAEEGISYGMPAFRLHGKVIAGFAAFKSHLTYVPHSGSVIPQVDTAGYSSTAGALRFPVDAPLPRSLVEKLIAVRLEQVLAERQPEHPARGGPSPSRSRPG
ncbi:MAG TPA: DUF1801 domain-containing protein [Candidatus Binatia bacterium]|nr:DUF1801 domain-containing protein [Candidatus Binatia bacterium]